MCSDNLSGRLRRADGHTPVLALIKVRGVAESSPGPTLASFNRFATGMQHFLLLRRPARSWGGPDGSESIADVAGGRVAGHPTVLTDPRTSVTQSLQAILTAEVDGYAGWESD